MSIQPLTERLVERSTRLPASLSVTAPLVVGVGLAFLYGIGALSKMGQLDAADVPAEYVLPLVPLPQLLTTGIQSAVTAVFLAPVFITLQWLTAHVARWTGRRYVRARSSEPGRLSSRVTTLLLIVVIIGGLIFFLVVAPWFVLPVVLGALWAATQFPGRPVIGAVAAYGVLLVGVTALSYLSPTPLPKASIVTVDDHRVVGVLAVTTGDGWVVAKSDRTVVTVPREEVREIQTHTDEWRPPSSVYALLSGLFA